MDPNLEFIMRTLTEKFDHVTEQLGQINKELGQVKERVGTLEKTPTEPELSRSIPRGPRAQHFEHTPEYNPRRLHPDFMEEARRAHFEHESHRPTHQAYRGSYL